MSFLAPLFLLGTLAVALPVIFHLIRRSTRERIPFSSVMFLMPSPPRLTRRSRLEHILLLILRGIVLCLLAFGFARPFLKHAMPETAASGPGKRLLILLDTSASMQRSGLWAEARTKAEVFLRQASPVDQVALFAFDHQVKRMVTFEQWNSMPEGERLGAALQRLADLQPGWAATDLGNALTAAAEAMEEVDKVVFAGPRRIVLISDLQEGSQLDKMASYQWPKHVEFALETVKARRPTNAGLELLSEAGESTNAASGTVRVRVTNASDSKREQFQVDWRTTEGRAAGLPVELYVPPGQTRVAALPAPGPGTNVDRLVLRGDEETFDNTVYLMPPAPARVKVLYLSDEQERDTREPLYYLQRAFQSTRGRQVELVVVPAGRPLVSEDTASASLLVVSGNLPVEQADAIRRLALEEGKTVLCALKSAGAAATLGRILGAEHLVAGEARVPGYAMLGDLDFQHPLFAPFADPRFSDFTKIHFWKYRRLEVSTLPKCRVVARFDNEDPAWIEVPLGKGRCFVLASSWHPADSQLALSTKFVPLMYSVLEQGGGVDAPPPQYRIGDMVTLPALTPPAARAIQLPDGSRVEVAAGQAQFSQTLIPGIYTVTSPTGTNRFAVNLAASESRTGALQPDELERLGLPLQHQKLASEQPPAVKARLASAELENRQKLWRWLLVAAIVVLLIEIWLSGWIARRQAAPIETTA